MKKPQVKRSIKKAIKIIGLIELGRKLNTSYQTISLWAERDSIPDREYSGKTLYSAAIEFHTDGKVTIEDILGTVPEHQAKELARLKKAKRG